MRPLFRASRTVRGLSVISLSPESPCSESANSASTIWRFTASSMDIVRPLLVSFTIPLAGLMTPLSRASARVRRWPERVSITLLLAKSTWSITSCARPSFTAAYNFNAQGIFEKNPLDFNIMQRQKFLLHFSLQRLLISEVNTEFKVRP